MQITITEEAGKFIRRMITFGGGNSGSGFRLAVKPGGCAGLTYEFNIEAEPKPADEVVEGPGFKVYVPADSRPYLEGTTVGFVETLMHSGLTFTNPNAGSQCGCGTSFSTEGGAASGGPGCGKR